MVQNSQSIVLIKTIFFIIFHIYFYIFSFIIFQKVDYNFEIEHKACSFLVRGAIPPLKSENGSDLFCPTSQIDISAAVMTILCTLSRTEDFYLNLNSYICT